MRTVAWLQTRMTEEAAARRAMALGLELTQLSVFTLKHSQSAVLILGFAGCNPGELRRGVQVLATALYAG
jgi:GntR family transcriptional regulator/MocR family aminotransferase